ncbi:MAG: GDSL-type esterase/lipase family protein [Bacteroidota bacterium]|nr:GDSL-type esterase/lipase family protein [Bacteroidota bacterium]
MNRLFFWLLTLLLGWSGGCASSQLAPADPAGRRPVVASAPTFLALGDSYTIGEGVAAADRWPTQLVELLAAQGIAVQAPTYIARTGWTTAELQAAIATANPPTSYGLVSLLIGVNNQYRGQGVGRYRPEFRALLQAAIRFAGGRAGRVVVLSVPDWGQSPFAQRQGQNAATIGQEIDQFNAAAQDECRQAGVAFVDITDLTRTAAGNRRQFTPDGLHYARAQLRLWAERARPVVQGLLQ